MKKQQRIWIRVTIKGLVCNDPVTKAKSKKYMIRFML